MKSSLPLKGRGINLNSYMIGIYNAEKVKVINEIKI